MKAKISRGGKLSAVFLFIFAVLGISLNLQTPTIDATPDRVDFAAFDEMSLADTLDLPERAPNVNISDTYTAPAVRLYLYNYKLFVGNPHQFDFDSWSYD